jgi:hypothetical protein
LTRVADVVACKAIYGVILQGGKTLEDLAEKRSFEKEVEQAQPMLAVN